MKTFETREDRKARREQSRIGRIGRIVTAIPALFTMPTDKPDATPRIHGVVRCKRPETKVSTPRIAGELESSG